MKTHGFFETKPYVVMTDSKGYYYIDNICTYGDLMGMVAEETTSPRGVESKLQVGGSDGDYFLFYWQPGGRRMILEHFSSIEDAELEWLNRIYEFDFLNHELSYRTFSTYDDAIEFISSSLEISVRTAISLIFWHTQLRIIFSQNVRTQRLAELKKALQNANGKPTKRLAQCVRKFKQGEPMWHNDYNLMVQILYTQEELDLYEQAKTIITCNQE